jgi:replicative DNA helicase
MTDSTLLLPQNLEAEEACVGSLLIDPSLLDEVKGRLDPLALNSEAARWVYEALLAVHSRQEAVDFVTVCDELTRQGRLEGIGGTAYITRLINVVPSAMHVQSYVNIVLDMHARSRLLATLGGAGALVYAADRPLDDAAGQLRSWLQDYEADIGVTHVAPVKEAADLLWEQIDIWRNNPLRQGETRYPATGFCGLDKKMGGLRPGFYLIAARASMGKTALALSITVNLVSRGTRVDYITTEMTPPQLLLRLVSSLAGLSGDVIESGNLSDEQHAQVANALGLVSAWPLNIVTGLATLSGVEAHVQQTDAGVVFLDFLGTINAPGDNRHLRLGAIARSILLLSQAQELPIVALHHLGRGTESRADKKPVMSDLYESGHLENNADGVLLLWREGYYDAAVTHSIMQVIIAKNRLTGQVGIVDTRLTKYGLVEDVKPRVLAYRTWEREKF